MKIAPRIRFSHPFFLCLWFLAMVIIPRFTFAQQNDPANYLEVPDDDYIQVPKESRLTSPAFKISNFNFFSTQVNVNANGENILGDAANEPSIAIDPTDPDRMVIGWRQFDTIASNFRQAGYGFTTDGGQIWTFPGVIEPGVFRSDPVLDFDSDGNFFYNSLTFDGGFACDVFQSTGDGTWDSGTFAQGGDKQWMVIDRTGGPGHGNIYTNWSESFSACPPGQFTRSTDGNLSYDDCSAIPSNPFWGTLSIGPSGSLYAVGADVGFVAISEIPHDTVQMINWEVKATHGLGGNVLAFEADSPNPGGLHGQVWVATDHSEGPTRGNVYMLASVRPTATSDPLDVMFSRSTDGGQTWSDPIRINDDPGRDAWQWFGTMSVAPNGRIDVIWLDTRDDPGSFNSSLYYSNSEDGGLTWSENERLSDSFDPHLGWPQQNKMGDYFHMISDDEGAHLAWAGTFNGEQDVYYGRILVSTVVGTSEVNKNQEGVLFQNYPNPFRSLTTLGYSVKKQGGIQLKIVNRLGQTIRVLVDEEKAAGDYSVLWNGKDDAGTTVSGGIYFYTLTVDGGFPVSKRMIFMK